MRDHFHHLHHYRGERYAVIEFRKRISWWAKQMHPCATLRDEMRELKSPAHFNEIVQRFLAWRTDYGSGTSVPLAFDASSEEQRHPGAAAVEAAQTCAA
jgi:hypothetical protein